MCPNSEKHLQNTEEKEPSAWAPLDGSRRSHNNKRFSADRNRTLTWTSVLLLHLFTGVIHTEQRLHDFLLPQTFPPSLHFKHEMLKAFWKAAPRNRNVTEAAGDVKTIQISCVQVVQTDSWWRSGSSVGHFHLSQSQWVVTPGGSDAQSGSDPDSLVCLDPDVFPWLQHVKHLQF